MKKLFCILSLIFFALCLVCGACYGGLVVCELVEKLKTAKSSAIDKLRDYVIEE